MKRLIGLFLFAAALSSAGPLKIASYPIRQMIAHPIKTPKTVGGAIYTGLKAVLW